MTYKKVQVFTLAAALGIVKSAVKQVSNSSTTKTDAIVFNSLNRAIAKKKSDNKGVKSWEDIVLLQIS